MKNLIKKFKNLITKCKLNFVNIFLFMFLGVSFAYFSPLVSDTVKTLITVNVSTVDELIFTKGKTLSLTPGSDNLNIGDGNYSEETTVSATLLANNDTNEATMNYSLYINFLENEYVYTTSEKTPELLLTITDKNNIEITNIEGLVYYENVNGLSGFDVTTYKGLLRVLENKSIYTNSTTIDEWTIKISMVNLETNQSLNAKKTLVGFIDLTKDVYADDYFLSYLSDGILINNAHLIDANSKEEAKESIEARGSADFTVLESEDKGLFAINDEKGMSYYFRGATEDNYVLFADMLWRIIRIDGSDNIKLMLFSENKNAENYEMLNNEYIKFNLQRNDESYLYYGNSYIKNYLDAWYDEELKTDYEVYLEATTYCMDLSGSVSAYGANLRLKIYSPSLICPEGHSDNFYIGIISADEMALAGSAIFKTNVDFYLYANFDYWTISPCYYNVTPDLFVFNFEGMLYDDFVTSTTVGVLPTITLKETTLFNKGDGTLSNPYVVAEDYFIQ